MKKIIIAVVLTITALIGKAQNPSEDQKQATSMLKTFYTAYMSAFSSSNNLDKIENTLENLRKKYCTVKCRRQYTKLSIDNDADPIIQAQDSDAKWAKSLSVTKNDKMKDQYVVSYGDDEYGTDGKLHRNITSINLALIKEYGVFKVDRFL